jgi:hypothetical protein
LAESNVNVWFQWTVYPPPPPQSHIISLLIFTKSSKKEKKESEKVRERKGCQGAKVPSYFTPSRKKKRLQQNVAKKKKY